MTKDEMLKDLRFGRIFEMQPSLYTVIKVVEELVSRLPDDEPEKEPELLPCPICGYVANLGLAEDSNCWNICCTNMSCYVEFYTKFDNKTDAINAWNKRAEVK